MLLTQNLGDSKTHSIPLTWEDAAFTPGGSWVLIFTAKACAEDPDTASLIQKTSGAGITVSGSTVTLTLVPDDTVDLAAATLFCDIQAQHVTTGAVRTVTDGLKLKLKRDITRETETSIDVITTEPPVPFVVDITGAAVLSAMQDLAVDDPDGFKAVLISLGVIINE